eukprot:1142351-Prorocentrum_minimum.AAC.1
MGFQSGRSTLGLVRRSCPAGFPAQGAGFPAQGGAGLPRGGAHSARQPLSGSHAAYPYRQLHSAGQ